MELPKAIICDLDGTLALLGSRSPHDASTAINDALNTPVANVIEVYSHQDKFPIELILISGRQEKYRQVTEEWLKKHGITHYVHFYLRPDADFRKDYVMKQEIYETHIKNAYDVIFALEDRDQVVKMWRRIGVTCFQVAYGDF